MSKNFLFKIFVVAFVWSWANVETNLGSYTPGNLQLQATVSSNISGFLARLQPLHLDHDYVGKGRSNISKSTLFIQEACSETLLPTPLHLACIHNTVPRIKADIRGCLTKLRSEVR